jgi:hypothetical protein
MYDISYLREVKTNKVSPASDVSLTLGDSGDTITIPSGATITNSGTATGFGALAWQAVVTASTLTAVAGRGYPINTTSNACTVTLPAGSVGDIVGLVDYAATWDTNNCLVAADGSEKIQGSTSDAQLSVERQGITFVYVDATQGWLAEASNDAGIPQPAYVTATGGTITCSGDFKIHTFTGDGTFTVTCGGNSLGSTTVDYLVGAGGGGGGGEGTCPVFHYKCGAAGGSGAGGYRHSFPNPATGGLAISCSPGSYSVTVGAGGADVYAKSGLQGSSSIFSSITSAGGGGGGGHPNCGSTGLAATTGGSGGGGADNFPGLAGNTPPVSPSQGNPGGDGSPVNQTQGGGGGGGSTGAGANAPGPTAGGAGGTSTTSCITASPVARAGGGGGGGNSSGGGGAGGGGGAPAGGGGTCGGNAAANTVSGAGGGRSQGGNGGSGVVIIRYTYK